MKNRTLLLSFLTPLLLCVVTIMSFYTMYNYSQTKERIISNINLDLESINNQLKDTLPYFINSYSINEYEKILENQMKDKNILAIIIKDYNYGKIFSKEFIETGKIKIEDKIVEFDSTNLKHQELLTKYFSFKSQIIENNSHTKIAEILIYSSNEFLKNELNTIIKKSLLEIFISSIFIILIIFFIIKVFILKPIYTIANAILNNDKDGIPKDMIPKFNTKELNELSLKMNEMITTIKTSKSKIDEINNRFELVIDSINEGIWDWNLITNEAYFSSKWKKLLGYEDNEIGNNAKYFFDLVHPDDKSKVEENLRNYLKNPENNIYSLEIRMKNKYGKYTWILTRGKVILDKNNKPIRILGTHSDISLRKELEKQIIKERDFISTIIDNSNAVIVVINSEGVMFKVNKYAQKFLGYTEEEISSEPYFWSRFLNENVKDKVINIIDEAKKGNMIKHFRNSWISRNGEEKVFEWSNMLVQKEDGSMDYLTTIGIDITEKELIEKQIFEQKQEFELIFNYSKDGIAILDLDSKFIKFNEAFLNMTELSEEDLLTKKLIDFMMTKNEKNKKLLEEVITKGYVSNYEETFIINNKRVSVNLSLSLLPDKERFLMVIKDVSSLKIMQEQAKLASLGEMIGNIAHQWRQPLSFISTSASALRVKSEYGMLNKEDIEESSIAIVKQTEYLSNTIDNFRDFIKEDKSYKEISVKEVLDNTLNLVYASLHNNFINLKLEVNDDLLILGNKNELTEAFLNIISNSKDVLKEKNEEDRFLFIKSIKLDENKLELQFLDSGGGIDESIISKVLEPYFTTKHKSQGTGLGLAIVDKIIRERHKGIINIHNEKFTYNQKQYIGACFSIIFENKF
ncbi:PAS domain S-box protein [Arcobacter sp. L]|uniref:PAS domain S-box protein n=1 Tax=Arcobacter sp. L TaxID=944547 RepID=UPI0002295D55|nr:PAS domain S-box protein [Arcobacter sp. L]BAK73275.1 two-component sensor kinase [Arcobacter sp. L]